jgi:hypothetical protein
MFAAPAILYEYGRVPMGKRRLLGLLRPRKPHPSRTGDCAMRFIFGLIVGILLVVGGAYIHDSMESGAPKPVVNWTNAAELQRNTFDYVKTQCDRLANWVTSSSK